ncbi:MAG: flavodoxin family protein [Candidatus Methanomethylophilaceae archaeon]|nr:flavodoxin family protein [Candidatus Methanomethylophilaceae archaeon]
MSKVVAIVSSPRPKGNSAALVDSVIDGAMGLSTNIIVLHSLRTMLIHGCNACDTCKTKGVCTMEDEMSKVLNDVEDADGIVISTPVYFNGPCSQYKMFEDRMYSFMDSNGKVTLPQGKKAVIIVTCSGPVEEAEAVYEHISGTMRTFGIEVIGKIVYTDEGGRKPAADNGSVLSEAKGLGKLFRTNYREYDPHYVLTHPGKA